MGRAKFQTIVDVPKFSWKTGYENKNLFMGSCFTENVGNNLTALKYDADINPFGILYNPTSVANGLEILLNKKVLNKNDLVRHNELWHSFSHHGRFSSPDVDVTLDNINSRIQSSSTFLKEAGFLFITFGTAWIYRYRKTNRVVSNCHKIPAGEFIRERLSVKEITEKFVWLLNEIWRQNADLKVIFTVSPIRHWKDGAIENQRSKASLLLAVEQIIDETGKERCAYFPSYEIVMDELRDYRFYAEDMLHLSDVAVNHIWDIFEESLIDKESREVAKRVQKIINAVNHRPINKNSKEYFNFLTQVLKKIDDLETKRPYLNFTLEKEYINVQFDELKKIDDKN
ncbi:MAG: GSCFA domain-containing protein [Bacteroidota bacterium]